MSSPLDTLRECVDGTAHGMPRHHAALSRLETELARMETDNKCLVIERDAADERDGVTPHDDLASTTVTITATRHKNERWRVHIVYPDGSYATHRGVVDYGYAGEIAERAISKAEDMLSEKFSPRAQP